MLGDLKSFHSPVRLEHGKKGIESTAVWCHQRPEPSIQEWGSWILIYLSSQSPSSLTFQTHCSLPKNPAQRSQKIGLVFPLLIFKAWCLLLQGLRESGDQDKSVFLLAPLTSLQQPGFSLLPDAQKRWAVTSDNSLSLSGARFPPL